MEVLILASGSSGNATLIRCGDTALLVDIGISVRAVTRRLAAFGLGLDEVDAVLLTHEHQDHVRGLDVLSRRHPKPVWATAGTWSAVGVRTADGGELCSGRELRLGNVTVLPVATSHDAREPVAIVVESDGHRVALCTDTGIMTSLLEQRLAGSELLLLETNHDADMLRHGPYPWPLKQRIASRHGHLANHQSEEAASRLRSLWLRGVVGLHLSEKNNSAGLARDALRRAAGELEMVEAVPKGQMLRISFVGDSLEVEHQEAPR